MITYYKNTLYEVDGNEAQQLVEIACISTDTKPTNNIVAGSLALETDTGDIYAFDGTDWNNLTAE